jgi:hypothetical protein
MGWNTIFVRKNVIYTWMIEEWTEVWTGFEQRYEPDLNRGMSQIWTEVWTGFEQRHAPNLSDKSNTSSYDRELIDIV